MINKFTLLSAVLIATIAPNIAWTEIYKQIGPDGRVTYSNVKLKGSKKLDLEPADSNFGGDNSSTSDAPKRTTTRAPATKTPTPDSFPKVDSTTQNQRDGKRKDILVSELDGEKKALEQAKKAYEEGGQNPEVFKTKDGKTRRNVAKFDDKMKSLQAEVDAHQRNIELLTKEINNLN